MSLLTVTPEQAFERDVADWILGVLSLREVTWGELLRSLPGVYPSLVLAALQAITVDPSIPRIVRRRLSVVLDDANNRYETPPRGYQWEANGAPLPVPHPLDFEWRFSPEAAELLLTRCERASEQRGTIALVGAPTLLIGSVKRRGTLSYVLLDCNRSVVSFLLDAFPGAQVFVFDACQEPPPQYGAAVTVLDPPWYDAHFRGFLWTAARLTAPTGRVLLSLPAIGTRPGIREERAALLAWATQLGLVLVDLEEGVLPYLTPQFERNALRAAGIANCPTDWRRGDLATFTVPERAALAGRVERPPPPPEEVVWPEVNASGVRVRFKPAPASPTSLRDLSLHEVVPGDILPSVSSRDPRRSLATVWTSGNRVFRSEHPLLLWASLQARIRGVDPEQHGRHGIVLGLSSAERCQLGEAVAHLLRVIQIEQGEYLNYNEATDITVG